MLNPLYASQEGSFEIEKPFVVMQGIDHHLSLKIPDYKETTIGLVVNNENLELDVEDGFVDIPFNIDKETNFVIVSESKKWSVNVQPIPLWFSVIPPLVAIIFALFFKEVFTAFFMGIFV